MCGFAPEKSTGNGRHIHLNSGKKKIELPWQISPELGNGSTDSSVMRSEKIKNRNASGLTTSVWTNYCETERALSMNLINFASHSASDGESCDSAFGSTHSAPLRMTKTTK